LERAVGKIDRSAAGDQLMSTSGSREHAGHHEETDFFVSYTSADRGWAEWIAWQLEEAGYRTAIQAWDSLPGRDFVKWMDQNLRSARHVLVVLSPAYVQAPSFTNPEWTAAIQRDPTGERAVLVPVRVADFSPGGMFGTRGWVDLVGKDEKAARLALLEGVSQRRLKPATKPPFPSYAGESAAATGDLGQSVIIMPPRPPFPGPDLECLRKAIQELEKQSEKFMRLPPIPYAQRMFLDMTFNESVRYSLEELACVNPVDWPDRDWAVNLSAARGLAEEKLTRVEAGLIGEMTELLRQLKSLREMVVDKYPQILDS
jgi:hypothetical protein